MAKRSYDLLKSIERMTFDVELGVYLVYLNEAMLRISQYVVILAIDWRSLSNKID